MFQVLLATIIAVSVLLGVYAFACQLDGTDEDDHGF